MSERPNYPPIRRVVTGHDDDNVAKVLIDAPATNAKNPQPRAGLDHDVEHRRRAGATSRRRDRSRTWARASSARRRRRTARASAVIDFPPGNHPHMHRTETVDYVIVMEGEIDMDMDDSTVKLKAGDIMVQRGTNHAWANRSGKRARVAFVLVDAEPLGIGKPVLGTGSAR